MQDFVALKWGSGLRCESIFDTGTGPSENGEEKKQHTNINNVKRFVYDTEKCIKTDRSC